MSKYYLVYYSNGKKISVNLSKIDGIDKKKINDLETLDNFTMQFENHEELMSYLKSIKLVDEDTFKVYIAKENKEPNGEKYKKIYNGEFLLFKNDKDFVNIKYINSYLISNLKNGTVMREIIDNYYKKYTIKNVPGIRDYIDTIRGVSYTIEKYGSDILTPSEMDEYINAMSNFIIFEFYSSTYNPLNGQFCKRYDSKDNIILRYSNMHNFIINLKKSNKLKYEKKNNVEVLEVEELPKEEVKPSIYHEHEEFLTEEDFRVANEEILSTYKYNKDDIVEEGHDIIKPLTKTELREELDNIGKKLIRR